MSRDVVIDVGGPSTVDGTFPTSPRFVDPAGPVEPPTSTVEADLDAEPADSATPGRPKFRLPNLAPAFALVARLARTLRRRKPADESGDVDTSATVDGTADGSDLEAGPADPLPGPGPIGRLSPAFWSWETRVGVAALFSFLVLIGVLATRRGWFGGSKAATVLAMGQPPKGEETPTPTGPAAEAKGPGDSPAEASRPTPPSPGEPEPAEGAKPASPVLETTNEGGPAMPTSAEPEPSPAPKAPSGAEPSLGAGIGLPDLDRSAGPAPQSPPNPSGDGLASLPAMGAGDVAENPARPPEMPTSPGGDPPALPGDPSPTAQLPAATTPAPVPVATPTGVGEPIPAEPVAAGPQGALAEGAVESAIPALPNFTPPAASPAAAPPATPAIADGPPPVTQQPDEPAPSTAPIRPADRPPSLESVPIASSPVAASPAEASAAPSAAVAAADAGGWITMPIAGKRRPIRSTPADADPGESAGRGRPGSSDEPGEVINARSTRLADPSPADDNLADQIEPVYHKVRSGENFWTISKLFYRSPRYYRALHAANARQVPDIADLYVGTVLRIPPPEALDRSLIDPAGKDGTLDGSAISRTSTSSADDAAPVASSTGSGRVNDDDLPSERMVRPGLRGLGRKPAASSDPGRADDPADVDRPRRRSYTVRPHETLRSIARDTLGDPRRSDEIYDLNRKALGSARAPLDAGMTLVLPADAVVSPR